MNPQRLIVLISGFVIFSGTLPAMVLAQVDGPFMQNNEHEIHPIETLPEQKKLRKKESGDKNSKSFRTVEWLDLMPKKDLDALLNPPDYISEMEEGAFLRGFDDFLAHFAGGIRRCTGEGPEAVREYVARTKTG